MAVSTNSMDTPAGTVPGIPTTPTIPFYRMGEPAIIAVSPTSANTPVQITIPPNSTSFRVVNNNPFSVRLRGTRAGQEFVAVTGTTGWLWLPGTEGIYSTVTPAFVSVMSVDGPYAKTDVTQKAGTGIIELQYGTGY